MFLNFDWYDFEIRCKISPESSCKVWRVQCPLVPRCVSHSEDNNYDVVDDKASTGDPSMNLILCSSPSFTKKSTKDKRSIWVRDVQSLHSAGLVRFSSFLCEHPCCSCLSPAVYLIKNNTPYELTYEEFMTQTDITQTDTVKSAIKCKAKCLLNPWIPQKLNFRVFAKTSPTAIK